VREELVRSESIAMLPTDIGQLLMYSRTGEIPAAVRDALARAIQLKQAMIDTEREIGERTQQINDITTEQNRIRENMKTVGQTTQYYQRLLGKLNEQESSIERLRQERDDLTKKRDTQRKALEDYLNALTVS
jgi:predicted RNase H-like nuclease (RuvC/YqgF family)